MTDVTTRRSSLQQRRWFVHLGLIAIFLAALATVGHVLFGFPIGVHSILGLGFAALILVHFVQRQHRVRGLLAQLRRPATWHRAAGRLAWSDLVLTFLFVNLIVSGVVDYFAHANGVWLHLGFIPAIRWHALSAILLLLYLIVHVARRAARLRTSKVS
jgi:hypothetical protein